MGTSIPLWAALVVAFVGPLLTLTGVFWTQRTNDRRSIREAELRLQAQVTSERSERLYEIYRELLASANALVFALPMAREFTLEEDLGPSIERFGQTYAVAAVLAPESVSAPAREFAIQATELRWEAGKVDNLVEIIPKLADAQWQMQAAIKAELLAADG